MTEPTESPSPANGGGEDSNYLIVSIAVGIPCGAIILALVLAIFVMFYLTCKTSSQTEEVEYRHRRFQGLSLEQQRQARANRKRKKQVAQRRESGVSGSFNPRLSRSPSSLSAAAKANPFGLQEWQLRVYSNAGLRVALGGAGAGGRRNSSPETDETEMSGDELHQSIAGQTPFPAGAINPLMVVRGQDHDPGYDTPPRRNERHQSHQHHPSHLSQGSTQQQKDSETSSDDSMNPYD